MTKRILSLVMVLCMMLTMVPAFAEGCPDGNNGTNAQFCGRATTETENIEWQTAGEGEDAKHLKFCTLCERYIYGSSHAPVNEEAADALCIGETAEADCTVCGQAFTVEGAEAHIPTDDVNGVNKNAASYPGAWIGNADGHAQQCKVCDGYFLDADAPAYASLAAAIEAGASYSHSFDERSPLINQGEEGHLRACVYCGILEDVDATRHVHVEQYDADGNPTGMLKCACGDVKECDHAGADMTYYCGQEVKCPVCNEVLREADSSVRHQWEWVSISDTQHQKQCSVCPSKQASTTEGHDKHLSADGKTWYCEVCDWEEAETCEHNFVWVPGSEVGYPATCDEDGKEDTYVCSICGKSPVDRDGSTIPAFHQQDENGVWHSEYEKKVIADQPTCYKDGKYLVYCEVCDEELRYETIDSDSSEVGHGTLVKVGYTVKNGVELKPTCTKVGYADWKCVDCGKVFEKYETIPALGHVWEQYAVNIVDGAYDPEDILDCTEPGGVWTYVACSVCGEMFSQPELTENPMGQHNYVRGAYSIGSCTEPSGYLWECTNAYCEVSYYGDAAGVENTTTPSQYHKVIINGAYVAPAEDRVDATCTEDGYVIAYCPTCGRTIKNDGGNYWVDADEPTVLPATGHSNKVDDITGKINVNAHQTSHSTVEKHEAVNPDWEYVEPTCKEMGYWESYCKNCNDNYLKVVDNECAKKHSYTVQGEYIGEVECLQPAKVEMLCEYCGLVERDARTGLVVEHPIAEAPHDLEIQGEPLVAPTCSQPGKAIAKCLREGCDFKGIIELDPTDDCEYVYTYTMPTCDLPSYHGYVCVKCGEFKNGEKEVNNNSEEIEDLIGDVELESDGTLPHAMSGYDTFQVCGMKAPWMKRECTRGCGHVEYFLLNDLEHPIDANTVKAVLNDETEHDFDNVVISEHSCTTDGLVITNTCTVCGLEKLDAEGNSLAEYDFIPASHTFDQGTETTFTDCTGTYTVDECIVCGEEIVKDFDKDNKYVGNKLDKHAAIDWDVINANGCMTEGFGTPYCTACGWKGVAQVMPAGHTWAEEITVIEPATCHTPGIGKILCVVCGAENTDEGINGVITIEPDPTLHTFARFVENSNRCDLESYVVYACTICGAKAETEEAVAEMDALGYTYKNEDVTFRYFDLETQKIETKTLKTVLENEQYKGSNHTWGPQEYREATCIYYEGFRRTCTICGVEQELTKVGDAPKHDWVLNTKEATCYVGGYNVEICFVCGATNNVNRPVANSEGPVYTYQPATPALGHDLEVDEKDLRNVAATCSTKGVEVEYCKRGCGYEQLVEVDYDDDNHVWTTVNELRAMDCTKNQPGLALQKCAYCNTQQKVRTIPVTHVWDDGVVVKEADCATKGLLKQTCTVCGKATKESTIGTVAHEMITIATEADCVNPTGITTKCANCDLVTKFVKTGAKALGHIWSEKTFVPADCENDSKYVWECLREGCGVTDSVTAVANSKLNHKGKVLIETIAATCVAPTTKVYFCNLCKEEVVEEIGYPVYSNHDWVIVNEYNDDVTCANPGYVDRECSLCHATTKKVWHRPECTMTRVSTTDCIYDICIVCGKVESVWVSPSFTGYDGCISVKVENGVKTLVGSHKGLVVKAGKDETCTEAGQITDIRCTVCGEVLVEGAEIPAHNTTAFERVEPTCDTVGYTAGIYCNDCKEWVSGHEEIPALGHSYTVIVPAQDATLTAPGHKGGVKCANCGAWEVEPEVIPALNAKLLRKCTLRSKPADYRDDNTSVVKGMLEPDAVIVITGELINEYYPVSTPIGDGYIQMNYFG